ncbi:MAG: hypothetical protein AAGE43_11610 [Pseudomonadota bacterium]
MNRSMLAYCWGECRYEIQMGLRSLVVPLVVFVLSIYMLLIFLNADYMRAMGAVDIYRNSAHLTFLMASGQSLWLYFAWAWLFAQIIVRDQNAQLQEVVLAAPVPLKLTLLSRFLGALVVALIMGAAVYLGFLSAPVLVALGALPPEAVGPAPWSAFGWSLLVFTLPNALGTGAVFLCAAIWTRSTAGPFSAAAAIALVWMLAMIVLRGGEVDVAAASVLDPSGYSEAERQSMAWTPSEKKTAIIALTDLLIYNRLLWAGLPLALLAFVLVRLNREQLAITGKGTVNDEDKGVVAATSDTGPRLPPISVPAWSKALVSEAFWHFKLVTAGFGIRLALVMLLLSGALGAWVNFVGHVDGPLLPTPEGLLPWLVEFFFIIIVFMVVGFVGVVMRRDDRPGFQEWVDASYAPLGVRLLAKSLVALALIALLCIVPAVSSLFVTALDAPASLDLGFPFAFLFWTFFPALAEIGVMAILAHAFFRHAGTAYVLSILIAFIAIINHEVSVVEYPPAQLAMPTHAHPSELAGWGPWLPMVISMAGLKFSLVIAGIGVSWMLWRRGSALTFSDRLAAARERAMGPAGAISIVATIAVVFFTSLLNTQLIDEGEFETKADAIAADINWEKTWWPEATAFSVLGGSVQIDLNPAARKGNIVWRLEGLKTEALNGTLPHGIALSSASLAEGESESVLLVRQDDDHFVVSAPDCLTGCDLILRLSVEAQGWPVETAPWLHGSGVWLRAENVLPTLGHDPRRLARSLVDRKAYALPAELPEMPAKETLTPIRGVAPAGEWRWQVNAPGGTALGAEGAGRGVLDFAYVWLPEGPELTSQDGVRFLASPSRKTQLPLLAEEILTLGQCVAQELGQQPELYAVIQSPRDLGAAAMHGTLLWAPEDAIWESDGSGLGGWQRQFNIAQTLGRQVTLRDHDLRAEHGAQWLLEGVTGWTALRCVERRSGFEAANALRKLQAEQLIETFAESDEPITTAADAYGDWLTHYATLALDNWGAADASRSPAAVAGVLTEAADGPLIDAMTSIFGEAQVAALMDVPKAGDVAITRTETGIEITATRWSWAVSGWEVTDSPTRLLLRTESGQGDYWIDPTQPDATGSGLLIDPTPRFERTLDDNKL